MPGLASLREEWLLALQTAGKSPRTIEAYRQDIIQLTVRLAGRDPGEFERDPDADEPLRRRSPLEQMAEVDVDLDDLTRRGFTTAWNQWSRGRSASSRQRAHSSWRQFMGWAIAQELWDAANPFDQIERPAGARTDAEGRRTDGPRTKAFTGPGTEHLYDRLLRAASEPSQRYARAAWPSRDAALITFIATTGARVSEVLGSRDWYEEAGIGGPREAATRNARFAPMTLRRLRAAAGARGADGLAAYLARGKGDKQRMLYVLPRVVALIEAYVADRDERIGEAVVARWRADVGGGDRADILLDAPLWWYLPPADGDPRPLTASNFDYVVRRVYRDAGLTKPAGACAHALRHTFLTRKADAGVPLHIVQRLAGHASLAVTERYLHPDDDRVREAMLVDAPDLTGE